MKTFQTLKAELAETYSKEYVVDKDSDDEVVGFKPRTKGEVEYVEKSISKKKAKHPVAPDSTFDPEMKLKEGFKLSDVSLKGARLARFKNYLASLDGVSIVGDNITGDEEAIINALKKFGV